MCHSIAARIPTPHRCNMRWSSLLEKSRTVDIQFCMLPLCRRSVQRVCPRCCHRRQCRGNCGGNDAHRDDARRRGGRSASRRPALQAPAWQGSAAPSVRPPAADCEGALQTIEEAISLNAWLVLTMFGPGWQGFAASSFVGLPAAHRSHVLCHTTNFVVALQAVAWWACAAFGI